MFEDASDAAAFSAASAAACFLARAFLPNFSLQTSSHVNGACLQLTQSLWRPAAHSQ